MQGIERCRKRRRSDDVDAAITLDRVGEAGTPKHLCIQAFHRQIEQREIGCVRRRDVLGVNVRGLVLDPALQRLAILLDPDRVAALLRVDQLLIVCQGKLGIDRQQAGDAVGVASGEANRELHAVVAARPRGDVLLVLPRREDLLEEIFELHFTPRSTRLDVREHFFQVADADGERLHLAEPLVDLLEAIGYELERLAQPQLECCVEFFVDRRAHLLELVRVFVAQQVKTLLDGCAHRLQAKLVALRQRRQALVLQLRDAGELVLQKLREPAQRLAKLGARALRALCRFRTSQREVGP